MSSNSDKNKAQQTKVTTHYVNQLWLRELIGVRS